MALGSSGAPAVPLCTLGQLRCAEKFAASACGLIVRGEGGEGGIEVAAYTRHSVAVTAR